MRRIQIPSAIVIGSGVVSLGVINDLAAEGMTVAHISPKPEDLALRSRWPVEKIVLKPEPDQTDQVLNVLLAKSNEWAGACLVPSIDVMLRIISKNLDILEDNYVTPVPEWKILFPIINKGLLYKTAANAGIPTPKVLYGNGLADATGWAQAAQYPVIVKPSQTPEFFARFHAKVLVANSADELQRHLDAVSRYDLDVMVSEIIPGEQADLKAYRSYTDQSGRVIAEMCSQKIRSQPSEFGVGIVQKTIPMNETMREQGQLLLNALNFRGFASIEFKYDTRDGKYKLIEINPRPAMVQRMFRKAGINFAKLTVDDLRGFPVADKYSYKSNVYCIHNSADLYHLKRFAKRGVAGLREYFAPYFSRHKVFVLPPIRDPVPFFYKMKRMIRARLRNSKVPTNVQE